MAAEQIAGDSDCVPFEKRAQAFAGKRAGADRAFCHSTIGHGRGRYHPARLPSSQNRLAWRALLPAGLRVAHRDRLIEVVESAFADLTGESLLAKLADAGVPAGRVRTLDEVYSWDQTASQGLLVDVEHPILGSLRLPGPPLRFFTGAEETTPRDHRPPPTLDEHGAAIRRWLDT